MRYFKMMMLVLAPALIALNAPALAEFCCPQGFVPDFYPGRCARIGVPQVTTPAVNCVSGPSTPSGGGGTKGSGEGGTFPQSGSCIARYPTNASRDPVIRQCVRVLSENAQFAHCLIESNDDLSEDQRTGLSCARRQQLLAGQCLDLCAKFATLSNICVGRDETWQRTFGGPSYGSARVELCGPPLKNGFIRRNGVIKRRPLGSLSH